MRQNDEICLFIHSSFLNFPSYEKVKRRRIAFSEGRYISSVYYLLVISSGKSPLAGNSMKRNSKEWKEKRAEFLKGKTCAWCGSSDSLCIHTPLAFSPAKVSSEIYSASYARFREIYRQKYQKFECMLTGKHRHKSHPAWHKVSTVHKIYPDDTDLEDQYIEVLVEDLGEGNFKELYHEWLEETGIKELIEDEIKKAEDDCEALANAVALCKRCHFASLRGMELCPVCMIKYKSLRYETCFNCLPEVKRAEFLAKQENKNDFSGNTEQTQEK